MGAPARPVHGVIASGQSFHRRYLTLTGEIEREFAVAKWRSGDVDIWPLARMDLYLDMYWLDVDTQSPASRAFPLRFGSRLLRPLVNVWKSRRDLPNYVSRPRPADVIFLGDGVSLDRVDGAWCDRFGEPIIAALEKRGLSTFLMQSGNLGRLPWRRPTFAANAVGARGWLAGLATRRQPELPDHEKVVRFLARNGVSVPSLSRERLARRAAEVSATASAFERVLEVVGPKLAFVVTYYAHLGHAFMLACRRRGILSVDLQHDPQGGAHEAYGWSTIPEHGYRTLPALFWNWTEEDAKEIQGWADTLALPWHRSLHGGHTQLMPFLDDDDPATRIWDGKFFAMRGDAVYEREILVALQPIGGHRADWEALASEIEAAPPQWRWWIRRHPASRADQDAEFGRLLSLRSARVMVEQAWAFPLPALLRHMDAVLSLSSGAAVEAAMFGVPALFLSDKAHGLFPRLIAEGKAVVADVRSVTTQIARLPASGRRRMPHPGLDLDAILLRLEDIARDYAALHRMNEKPGGGAAA